MFLLPPTSRNATTCTDEWIETLCAPLYVGSVGGVLKVVSDCAWS